MLYHKTAHIALKEHDMHIWMDDQYLTIIEGVVSGALHYLSDSRQLCLLKFRGII